MAIRRLVLMLFAATLAGVILTACGMPTVSGRPDGHEPSEKTKDGAGSRDEADGSDLPEPPGSTLSHGGETVSAGLGSYCWISVCADTFAVPVSEETLTVPAGSALTFAYGGDKLDSLSVSAHRIGKKDRLKKMAGGTFLMPGEGGKGYERIRLPTRRSGTRARITAELVAGEYAVEAFARFPEGDALYGFRVIVE